jgi:hypothetical protein
LNIGDNSARLNKIHKAFQSTWTEKTASMNYAIRYLSKYINSDYIYPGIEKGLGKLQPNSNRNQNIPDLLPFLYITNHFGRPVL